MDWFSVVILVLVLGGAAWVWVMLNNPKHGVVGCCGCGMCAHTGECVLVKQQKKALETENDQDPS